MNSANINGHVYLVSGFLKDGGESSIYYLQFLRVTRI